MSLLKEDGTTLLSNEAAQDYINELEAQVKVIQRSKAALVDTLDTYQAQDGLLIVMKQFIMDILSDPDVTGLLAEEIIEKFDVQDEVIEVLNEEDMNQYLDTYEVIDDVVDSATFESKVEDIIMDKLNDINFKVIIQED